MNIHFALCVEVAKSAINLCITNNNNQFSHRLKWNALWTKLKSDNGFSPFYYQKIAKFRNCFNFSSYFKFAFQQCQKPAFTSSLKQFITQFQLNLKIDLIVPIRASPTILHNPSLQLKWAPITLQNPSQIVLFCVFEENLPKYVVVP